MLKEITRMCVYLWCYGIIERLARSIAGFTIMADYRALEERLAQLTEIEEDRFLAGFHQQFQKERKKA